MERPKNNTNAEVDTGITSDNLGELSEDKTQDRKEIANELGRPKNNTNTKLNANVVGNNIGGLGGYNT